MKLTKTQDKKLGSVHIKSKSKMKERKMVEIKTKPSLS